MSYYTPCKGDIVISHAVSVSGSDNSVDWIGKRGKVVERLTATHGVRVEFPQKGAYGPIRFVYWAKDLELVERAGKDMRENPMGVMCFCDEVRDVPGISLHAWINLSEKQRKAIKADANLRHLQLELLKRKNALKEDTERIAALEGVIAQAVDKAIKRAHPEAGDVWKNKESDSLWLIRDSKREDAEDIHVVCVKGGGTSKVGDSKCIPGFLHFNAFEYEGRISSIFYH